MSSGEIGLKNNDYYYKLMNHKKNISDNSEGFPVEVHFNRPDHSFFKLDMCYIQRRFLNNAQTATEDSQKV